MKIYDSDGYRTLTFRIDKATTAAYSEGLQDIHYGDSLNIVLSGSCLRDVDPDEVTAGFFTCDSAASSVQVSTEPTSGWAFVPNCTDRIYGSISLFTAEAAAAVSGKLPGEPVELRFYAREDGGKVLVDTSVNMLPCPAMIAEGGAVPGVISGFILKTKFSAAGFTAIAAMPTLTPAQREARVQALLVYLGSLATTP
jgi:hypothetical protein